MESILKKTDLCSLYREKLFNFFVSSGTEVTIKKKNIIEFAGKPSKYVYLIKKGFVQQYFLDPSGNTKTLLLLTKGDLFGEITLFQADKDLVITQAFDNVVLEKIPSDTFLRLTDQNPEIYKYISLMLSNKTRIIMAQIHDSAFCSAEDRLKNLLLRLSQQHGEKVKDGTKIIYKFTHEDLARMLSSTRSTVTKKLKQLEEKGIIKTENHYIIIK